MASSAIVDSLNAIVSSSRPAAIEPPADGEFQTEGGVLEPVKISRYERRNNMLIDA
jgi:hypothetical protein